jgi:WD40 repeat protein
VYPAPGEIPLLFSTHLEADLAGAAHATRLHRLITRASSDTEAIFSPDGKRVLTGRDSTASIWDVATGHELVVLKGHTAPLRSLRFSRDGHRVVTASLDATARIWDAESGREIAVLK